MRRLIGVVLAVFLCALFLPFSLRADGGSASVQMSLSPQQVSPGDSFTLEVKVDSGQDRLGAFQFEIEYDSSVLELDDSVGLSGVEPGDNGFAKNGTQSDDGHCVYIDDQDNNQSEAYCVNVVDGQDGKKILRVNGFNANGVGPGDGLSVIKVHFKVKDDAQPGQTTIKLFADNSNSEDHHPMGIVALISGSGENTSIVKETVQNDIEATVNVASAQTSFTIILHEGWNLISIPVMPQDTSIESVLGGIKDNVEVVWSYQYVESESKFNWFMYNPNNALFSDLETMKPGYGYWIKVKSGSEVQRLEVTGNMASFPIELKQGWNLVGYNSSEPVSASQSFQSIGNNVEVVWSYQYVESESKFNWFMYNPNNALFSDLETMKPGYGYWIKVKGDCEWNNGGD